VRATGNTKGGTRPEGLERPVTDPGFTVTSRADQQEWCFSRPATTIACDPRVQPPGHKENAADPPGRYNRRDGKNAVRVEVHEAAVLQSFSADYPFQGSRTKQFSQVGNAVPPLLAAAVIRALCP
jgi:DNA (cytosine-5)-methyltransferase 1